MLTARSILNTGKRGFTLIELMAVIIILSLTAALGAVRLSSVSNQTALKSAIARWRDLDAKARLHARAGTPITIVLTKNESEMTIQNTQTHEILATATWPDFLSFSLQTDSSENSIPLSRTGTSPDYALLFSTNDQTQRFHCFGLTGFITRDQE